MQTQIRCRILWHLIWVYTAWPSSTSYLISLDVSPVKNSDSDCFRHIYKQYNELVQKDKVRRKSVQTLRVNIVFQDENTDTSTMIIFFFFFTCIHLFSAIFHKFILYSTFLSSCLDELCIINQAFLNLVTSSTWPKEEKGLHPVLSI